MKILALQLLALFATVSITSAVDDPVKEYLSTFSPLGGDSKFYSDDRLIRLDVDLNNDGQKEVLLSMARDRDGRQGNVWTAYAKNQGGYSAIGGLTFNPSRFYIGNIDEIHRYGLVTFGPAGAGEGVVRAYLFDGSGIREVQIGAVTRDQQTRELAGESTLNKYLGEKATLGDEVATVIDAATMSQKYGVKVEAITYRQVIEGMLVAQKKSAEQAATPRSLSSSPPSTSPSYSVASQPASAASPAASASPANVSERVPRSMLFWIGGIGVVAVIGVLIWKTRS